MPGTKVQEHSGSEKAMVWSCVDFADEVQKPELFCLRFGTPGIDTVYFFCNYYYPYHILAADSLNAL